MENLPVILNQNTTPNIKFEIQMEDLMQFGNMIVQQTVLEFQNIIQEMNKPDKLLRIEEVSKILQVSKPSLWRYNDKDILNNIKIGKNVRYRKSDIDAVIRGDIILKKLDAND